MKLLKTILGLLTLQEKKRGLTVLVMVVGMAILEAVGVASVMPFLAVLGNPEMIKTNAMLKSIYAITEDYV